ncbi:SGNH hydrolase domain-containing protein [Aeromicrobium chenweiae]|uniref:SGNH domain-containing protein n=1 Tax=Aeromicrobium chenweiae TaxID=2079793 RepID=A0A2S0WQU1_9ACTN|nr:SGNH hydrolase domain-containing protein [Aeromicrobium chenweiae]AWB93733.1 hypothetical protein C3E78_16785 [Aeromicrobium chenweiae]TGN30418.1 hypothetical protein E4L97_17210 [Aeromicrobium chenweiae]
MLARRRLLPLVLVVLVVAVAGVVTVSRTSSSPSSDGRLARASADESPGAAALLDPANADVDWSEVGSIDSVRPLPRDAKADRPALYAEGCQVVAGDSEPNVCADGDPKAERTVMLVGDSKIGQWQTAFADLGRREGWRVLSSTKSACAFTDADMTSGGKPFTDCREWGRATLADVLEIKPDVVVTSQVHDKAVVDGKRSKGAMIRGLHRYWEKLEAAGIQVVVLLDNPMPTSHPTYQCVEDHADDLTRCAYELAGPLAESSAPMQRAAAEATPGVEVIDMAPTYCPGQRVCPAVIGNVLVYRAGSHLTKTFVVSAERQLSKALAKATDGAFGTP